MKNRNYPIPSFHQCTFCLYRHINFFAPLSKVWFRSILKTVISKILELVTVCVWKYGAGLLFQVVKKVFATTNNRAVDIDNWKIELGGMILIQNIFQSFKKTLCNLHISFLQNKEKGITFQEIWGDNGILWKFLVLWQWPPREWNLWRVDIDNWKLNLTST